MNEVVVGVSASSGSPDALRHAAAEAKWRGATLVAVQAWRPPRPPAAPGGHPPAVSRDVEAAFVQAQQNLHVQTARALGASTHVNCKLVRGTPIAVLVAESAHAELLVVNAPGPDAVSRSPLLAERLILNGKCPILVVPSSSHETKDSGLKRSAARLAADAAKAAATAGRPGIRF